MLGSGTMGAGGSGGGTPGGSDGNVQYNNGNVFGGFGGFNDGTNLLTLAGGLTIPAASKLIAGTTQWTSAATDLINADAIEDGAANAIPTLAQETNWDAHLSSDGSDHTFLDQSVISGASPTFDGTNFTGIPNGALDEAYLNADGTVPLTADWAMGAFSLTGGVNATFTGLGTFGNLDADTLNLNGNVISDSTGTISFDDEILTTTGSIKNLADNSKHYFGAGDDYSIEWDGSDAVHTITAGDFRFTGDIRTGIRGLWGDIAGQVALTNNAYYDSGWKHIVTDEAALFTMYDTGNFVFYGATSGTADAAASFTEWMRINSIGLVGIGVLGSYPSDSFGTHKLSIATTDNAGLQFSRWSANVGGSILSFIKSRHATIGSHTVVVAGDTLGTIAWSGSDGTNFDPAIYIQGQVDAVTGTVISGRILFKTKTTGSVMTTALTIDDDQVALFASKVAFTQTDGNEYIDSLADGYLDLGATTAIRLNGGVIVPTINGIDYTPGSDTDVDLITVNVTGTPKLWWDEATDSFEFNKSVTIPGGSLKIGGIVLTDDGSCLRTSDFHAHGDGSVAGYYKLHQGTTPSADAEADHSILWADGSGDLYLQDAAGADRRLSAMDASNSLSVARSTIPTTGADRAAINFGGGGSLIGATADTDALLVANAYYNTGYKYLTTDLASAIKLDDGEIVLSTAISGTVDEAITWKDVVKVSVGKVFINETSNAKMAEGLTINQGANDDEAFALKSSDVSHGVTGWIEADTYMLLKKSNADGGGALIRGISDGDYTGLQLNGIMGANNPTESAIVIKAHKYDGGTTAGAIADTETILAVQNGPTVRVSILGNGDLEMAGQIKITGGTPGAGKVLTSDADGLASWV